MAICGGVFCFCFWKMVKYVWNTSAHAHTHTHAVKITIDVCMNGRMLVCSVVKLRFSHPVQNE